MIYKARVLNVVAAILLCCLPTPSSQKAAGAPGKLLNDVIQAHGSQKALSCDSILLNIDVLLDPKDGRSAKGAIAVKPDRFRLEYEIAPGNKYRMGYDGSQAWLISSATARAAKRLDLLQVGLFQFYSLAFSSRWLGHLKAQAASLKHAGRETYRGAPAEVLQANIEPIGNVDFLIDAKTSLLKGVRFIFPAEGQPDYEITYDSYMDKDGMKVPGVIDIYRNNSHYRQYKVREVRVCENISDDLFAPDIKR
ncbi:MAG TPA: hypothetical protein VE262_12280 [Blastocatellia bacterium]|nr:hypothetical protein [Blastocatellia bacterium]